MKIEPVSRPAWTPLDQPGSRGISSRGLLRLDHLALAMLRFDPKGTINEHAAEFDIDGICLEGKGYTSIGSEKAAINAGERVQWLAGIPHRLWTEENGMVTLMVEHL